jgi:hypothetical protein
MTLFPTSGPKLILVEPSLKAGAQVNEESNDFIVARFLGWEHREEIAKPRILTVEYQRFDTGPIPVWLSLCHQLLRHCFHYSLVIAQLPHDSFALIRVI